VATAWAATNDHAVVVLGDESADHVALGFHRSALDPELETWVPPLEVSAAIAAGGFSAACAVAVAEEELIGFRRQVARVCASQEHEAVVQSLEERLSVRVRLRLDGGVDVQGHASDDLREGSTLGFALRGLDRRCLPRLLRRLREVEAELGVHAGTNGTVEVRSRFNGTWVPGFEVAEVHELDSERVFRVRRCSDGVLLPTHFGSDEVRTPAL
jgi:hypothetical protein